MPGFVYFIQAGPSGPIKIGYAQNPESRMLDLQVGNHEELRLLAYFPGSEQDEARMHKRFDYLHARGEWFHPGPDIFTWILEARGRCGLVLVVPVTEPEPPVEEWRPKYGKQYDYSLFHKCLRRAAFEKTAGSDIPNIA